MRHRRTTSGLIGYLDGEPAGWVAVEPRDNYPRAWSRKQSWMRIDPDLVGVWSVTADGLSPRSIRKYHTVLHSIIKRAVRDQLIVINPCEHSELPKVITRQRRTITPAEFDALLKAVPARHRLLVETAWVSPRYSADSPGSFADPTHRCRGP